jgi:hypothetical protein
MKKYILTFIGIIAMSYGSAQTSNDILQYSTETLSGSARFRGMSGAFGALGGDFSAFAINPAGSAVFMHSELTATLGNSTNTNDSFFFNGYNSEKDRDFNINQFGAVFVFKNQNDVGNWRKFSLGFNMENTNNSLNGNTFAAGFNPNNSIDQYFLAQAQGIPLDLLQTRNNESITDLYQYLGETEGEAAQKAMLAYQAFLIDPLVDDADNTAYVSNASYLDVDQQITERTEGYNYKFTANLAGQYKDKLYVGLNLNSHVVDFRKYQLVSEIGFDSASDVSEVTYENELRTIGNGFSFQLGAIAKLSNEWRAGFSFQSPTWYNLQDETEESLQVFHFVNGPEEEAFVNPRAINIFEAYRIQSPAKITGSLAYIFGKDGLISFDYGRKDYSKAKLKPSSDPQFNAANGTVASSLTSASTYRLGGEWRVERLSLRAGYRIEESPYKDSSIMSDLDGYSLGMGYSFGATSIDLSFDQASQSFQKQFFPIGLSDAATINNTNTNVMVSVTFKI